MATFEKAEKIQDKIYQKMSAQKKLRIVGQFFNLAKKLSQLNSQKLNGYNRRPSLQNRGNFKKA